MLFTRSCIGEQAAMDLHYLYAWIRSDCTAHLQGKNSMPDMIILHSFYFIQPQKPAVQTIPTLNYSEAGLVISCQLKGYWPEPWCNHCTNDSSLQMYCFSTKLIQQVLKKVYRIVLWHLMKDTMHCNLKDTSVDNIIHSLICSQTIWRYCCHDISLLVTNSLGHMTPPDFSPEM